MSVCLYIYKIVITYNIYYTLYIYIHIHMYIKHSPLNRVGCHPLQKSSSQRGQSPFSLKTLQLPDNILHQPPQIPNCRCHFGGFPLIPNYVLWDNDGRCPSPVSVTRSSLLRISFCGVWIPTTSSFQFPLYLELGEIKYQLKIMLGPM